MDYIEGVDVDVDEDGVTLELQGDFQRTFEDYTWTQACIRFKISQREAEALVKMLRNAFDI